MSFANRLYFILNLNLTTRDLSLLDNKVSLILLSVIITTFVKTRQNDYVNTLEALAPRVRFLVGTVNVCHVTRLKWVDRRFLIAHKILGCRYLWEAHKPVRALTTQYSGQLNGRYEDIIEEGALQLGHVSSLGTQRSDQF
ncbi:hypothetical protein CEP51_011468 [Fusarium floridanum]|uniref:Uncharacterized protein n=1 Tax=Fusarium floridanum TaxID=1325733 RepID=A0A428RAZ5_9HYPO|nr:hypothetical protein CEP51_011468 [Fusarium floridanum]